MTKAGPGSLLSFAFFVLVASPVAAWGQCCTQLDFARVLTAEERRTTGLAIVNPTAREAAVAFSLHNPVGARIVSSSRTVPAGGQLAVLASELFPGITPTGWIQASGDVFGLVGFWLGGDFVTTTDGEAVIPPVRNHLLPVAGAGAEIHVVNPQVAALLATFEVFDASGQALAPPVTTGMESKGSLRTTLAELFPPADLSSATHLRIASQRPIAAAALIRDFMAAPSWAVVHSADADLFVPSLHFPQVVSGSLGGSEYRTTLSVTNLSLSPQTITLTFTPGDGGTPSSAEARLEANGTFRGEARSIFAFPEGEFQDGWVHVQGETGLSGFVAYADLIHGGVAATAAQTEASPELLFAHIADLDPWWTGIALLNETGVDAQVEVFALNADGSLIGGADDAPTARFTLPAGMKSARLLGELIPATRTRAADGGFVFVRSSAPLYGTELFFRRDLSVLANVTSGAPAEGVSYTPPAPQP